MILKFMSDCEKETTEFIGQQAFEVSAYCTVDSSLTQFIENCKEERKLWRADAIKRFKDLVDKLQTKRIGLPKLQQASAETTLMKNRHKTSRDIR